MERLTKNKDSHSIFLPPLWICKLIGVCFYEESPEILDVCVRFCGMIGVGNFLPGESIMAAIEVKGISKHLAA